jgi:hypothetical protein
MGLYSGPDQSDDDTVMRCGRYAYPAGGAVSDAATKKAAAWIPTTETLPTIGIERGKAVQAGCR